MSTVEKWGELGRKYEIHEETLDYFRIVESRDDTPLSECTPEKARAQEATSARIFGGDVEFDGKITEFHVPVPNLSDGIPISVYKPSLCPPSTPVLVYFHGGGFVCGSRDTVDSACKCIARDTPCIVVSVEFRHAPEHKLPACFDDAVCVTRWVKMNRAVIGASNISHLGTGGDSVGGHIATTVCHEVPGLDFQVLIYPMVDLRSTQPYASMEEFATAPGLNQTKIDWYVTHSLQSTDQLSDPRVTPLLRTQFAALPPALFVLAELDPLRDCGYAYRDLLSEAGVDTKLVLIKGAPHAFFRMPGHFKQLCDTAFKSVTDFIRKAGEHYSS